MNNDFLKPKKRSKLRVSCGKLFYTFRRYCFWYFSSTDFAGKIETENLKYPVFTHSTPLFRNLSGLDDELQRNKKTNLSIAGEKLNGIVIHPGETFSFWKLIGRVTGKKGYLPGMYLFYGKVVSKTGGGLCQLSNLLYWITLHSPLTVTERYRHSYDVFPDSGRTQPFGSGATCVYNYRDLMIKNNTAESYQLKISVNDDVLNGELRSDKDFQFFYEVYEKEHIVTREVWGKYVRHNLLYRKKFNLSGILIEDEFIAENHALMMYNPFIEKK